MSSSKQLTLKFQPGYEGLWSGDYPAQDKTDDKGNRTISVEFWDECLLTTSALASEFSQVTTRDVQSARLVTSRCLLVLELAPGCEASSEKVLRDWTKAVAGHLSDLPRDRHDALTRTAWPSQAELESEQMSEDRVANAMATHAPGGFNHRGR